MKINLQTNTPKNKVDIYKSKLNDFVYDENTAKRHFNVLKNVHKEGCYKTAQKIGAVSNAPSGFKSVGFRFVKHDQDELFINGYSVKEQINKNFEKEKVGVAFKLNYKLILNGNNSYVEGIYKNSLNAQTKYRVCDVDDVNGTVSIFGRTQDTLYEIGQNANVLSVISENTLIDYVVYDPNVLSGKQKTLEKTFSWIPCDIKLKENVDSIDNIKSFVAKTFNLNLPPLTKNNVELVWELLKEQHPHQQGLCLAGDASKNTRNEKGNYACGYKYSEHVLDDQNKVKEIIVHGITCINNKDKNVDTDNFTVINKYRFKLFDDNITCVFGNENKSESQTVLTEVSFDENLNLFFYFEGPSKKSTLNNGSGIESNKITLNTVTCTFFNINQRGTSDNDKIKETAVNYNYVQCIF